MNIALLTAHLSDKSGGLARSIPPLANALRECDDVSVRIFGVRDDTAPQDWRHWGAYVWAGPEVGPRAFGFCPTLLRAVASHDPDIIDAQGLWMYPSLASLRWYRRKGRPYVVTPHGMLDPWALRRSAWKKRLVSWWFERKHLGNAACLRATSAMEATHFRAYGLRNPVAVVPNGVELPPPRSYRREQDALKRLLFLSRIHPKKGLEALLRAWSQLQRIHLDWELVIAGPDERGHARDLQRLSARLEVERVRWLGAVHGGQKFEAYSNADLFVLPTHAENFGLVVAEALAHELPVITTTNAPWEGLHQHRCGWWIQLSVDSLRRALDEAMGLAQGERRLMGARGREWMQSEFSWPAIGRQMREVYAWLLGGGSPPPCVALS